jgi:hypothetical protein
MHWRRNNKHLLKTKKTIDGACYHFNFKPLSSAEILMYKTYLKLRGLWFKSIDGFRFILLQSFTNREKKN